MAKHGLTANVGGRGRKGTLITRDTLVRATGDDQTKLIVEANNVRMIQSAMNQAVATALEEIGLAAESFAKGNLTRNHSVDTGRLRNSVTHAIDSNESAVYVGTNVEYAPYVELGTSRSTEKPYLRPAASDHMTTYESIVRRRLQGA